MKSYIGSKIIQAESMTDINFENERRMFNDAKSVVNMYKNGVNLIQASSNGCNMSNEPPREPKEGYKVMYPDGYFSWSPKYVFDEAYRLISDNEKKII